MSDSQPAARPGADPTPDVLHIARLARLSIEPERRAEVAAQFARILEAFQALSALDVEGVEPMTRPADTTDVVREDRERPSLGVEAALLACATEFWNQSLSAEVYTLSTALLALCLERLFSPGTAGLRPGSSSSLFVAALAAGLAFGVHYNVGVPCAVLVAAAAWRARSGLGRRGLLRVAGLFALGLPFVLTALFKGVEAIL